jgi:dUTP pyrophosphatase
MNFTLKTGRIERATRESAAFDLFATTDVLMVAGRIEAIPTGVTTEFDPRLVAIVKEKSGLALKGIEIHGGVIDADYRDEWKVIAKYMPKVSDFEQEKVYAIRAGQKIAQFILIELPKVEYIGDGILTLDNARLGGFGSTGTGLPAK